MDALKREAAEWPGIDGMDLVPGVTTAQRFDWDETTWTPESGLRPAEARRNKKVVVIDYGIKRNILRLLADAGCAVTVLPATATTDDILALKPDGVFLSNGPGDPAETGKYAAPVIRDLLDKKVPTFGICLGHQIMALAIGAQDDEDASGPSRRQPSGQGFHHRQGRDRLHEPWLRG